MSIMKFDVGDIQAIYTNTVMRGENFLAAEAFVRDLVLPKVQGNMEWAKDFSIAPTVSPLPDIQGYASYVSRGWKRRPSVMLDAHVPGTEVSQEDTAGYTGRMGMIPQFARGLFENADSMEMYESIAKTQGADVAMEQFANNTARLLNGLYAVATRLAHQKLTTGKCMANWGNGVAWELESTVAADHFLKAGALEWGDADCDIPTQVQKIYTAIREKLGDVEWKGKMLIREKQALEQILINKYVVAEVNKYKDMIGSRSTTYVKVGDNDAEPVVLNTGAISLQDLQDYSNSPYSKFPRIEYREGTQFTSTIANGYNNFATTSGWKDGAVVIMPDTPYAGMIMKAPVRDIVKLQRHKAQDVIATWTSVADGMGYLLNVKGKQDLLETYDTKLFASFVPELTEWEEHFIIDTTTAD